MPLLRSFRALRPRAEHAAAVAAPPYDVLSTAEARVLAAGKPYSFLHVSKPEIDLAPETDPHDPAVYAKAAENLQAMWSAGVLFRDERPAFYVYRMQAGDHVQTGIAAAASVAAYESNRIRKHEFTRPDKEDDRTRIIEALNAQTGPVLLAYPAHAEIDALLRERTELSAPDLQVTGADGVVHSVWVVSDPDWVARVTERFDALPALYIADGHHRSAAAARVAARRREQGAGPDHDSQYFLSVAFPHHEMRILGYHRVVRDLNGMTAAAFLERIARDFDCTQTPDAEPRAPGAFGLYLAGTWYRLRVRPERIPREDPVARLDASLLSDLVLGPVLGIEDIRRDPRVDFVGGSRGMQELERRVDSGEMAAAFALHPVRMEDIMAVADAGSVMPPKSTWFEPKLLDGLVSHVISD